MNPRGLITEEGAQVIEVLPRAEHDRADLATLPTFGCAERTSPLEKCPGRLRPVVV